jgi:hypothetical protein
MLCEQAHETNVDASLPGTHQLAAALRVRRKRVRAEDLWDRDEDERERLAKKPTSAATCQPEPVDEQVYTKSVITATIVTSQPEPVNEQAYTKPVSAAPATIVTPRPEPVDEQVCIKPGSNVPATIVASPPKPVERERLAGKHVSAAPATIITSLPVPMEPERLAEKPVSPAPATMVTSQPEPLDEQAYAKPVSPAPAIPVTSQPEPVDEQAYTKPDEASLFGRPEGHSRIAWVLPKFAQGLHRPCGTGRRFGQPSAIKPAELNSPAHPTPASRTGYRFGQPSVIQPAELNSPPHPPPDATFLSLGKHRTSVKRSIDSSDHGSDPQKKARKRKRPSREVSGVDRHLHLPQTPSNMGSWDKVALNADGTSTEQELRMADRPTTFPKFMRLPEDVQDIIYGMLLQSDKPIRLMNSWFKPDMPPGLKVPSPTIIINGVTSLKSPGLLHSELQRMRSALENQRMRVALENASQNQQSHKHQRIKGLTLSLLLVSKSVHERAAQSFYGENVFDFLELSESWLHLDTFLTSIGCKNAKRIQHLRLKVPKWYPNASADAIAGALIDAASSGRRSVSLVIQTEDRLLSAISACTQMIATVSNLKSFSIHMQHKEMAAFLNVARENWGFALSADEKVSHEKRKEAGVRLLRALGDALSPGCKPLLVVSGTTGSLHCTRSEKKGLQSNINSLPLVVTEAERYGWDFSSVIIDKKSLGPRR